MRFSVAICTWNRCKLLRKTLERMTFLRLAEDFDWELILVNNNSSDETETVAAAFETRLPIRRVFEGNPGLSNARNRAVAEARGDWIVWTDDDVLVGEHWLASYSSAVERHPEAGVFGGPVEPWFEGVPPKWLQQSWKTVGTAYCLRDFGAQEIPLSQDLLPFGANFATRRSLQRTTLFDTRLGLRPGVRLLGEEVTVIRRILRQGASGWWLPEAGVRHYIPRERQTVTYLKDYYHGLGRSDAILAEGETQVVVPMLLGRPRWMWRQALGLRLRYWLCRATAPSARWLEALKKSSEAWGRLRGSGPARTK